MRSIHYIAALAPAESPPPEDLPGAGRWDLVARVVMASLMTSHGLRPDVTCTVHFGGSSKWTQVRISNRARHLHPGERSVAAWLGRAFEGPAFPVFQHRAPGLEVAAMDPASVIGPRALILDVTGSSLHGEKPDPEIDGPIVVGDHQGLPNELQQQLLEQEGRTASLGPVALHADQAISVWHNVLDRRQSRSGEP